AADEVRSRIAKLSNKREVDVISGGDIRWQISRAGMPEDTLLDEPTIRTLGKLMRADEYVVGEVERGQKKVRISGRLVLMRDRRMSEPLPAVSGEELGPVAEQFGRELAAARSELTPQRRCENALRDLQGERALQFAREAVAAYPAGVLAHVCLTWALRATGAPAVEVLGSAKAVLAGDSLNPHGLESAAIALDSLRRRDESATYWLRLAETDTADLDLTQRVVLSMVFGGSARRAEPLIVRAANDHPDSLGLRRLEWRVTFENRHWPAAIKSGEALLAADSSTAKDSLFTLRLASAYRANGDTYKAIALAAKGVAAFPGDVKLYTLYSQFVKSEADTVVPRGTALFPRSAELLAMQAKDLRAKGQLAEALAASRQALAVDSTIDRGEMMIAQGEIELGRPDSALAALRRAVTRGEDTALIAQFALGRGNALLRAANGTKSRDDFQLAMRFLALADTLRRTPQSAFLLGVAAYSITQSALSDAPKMTEKTQSCELSHLGAETLPVARAGLEAGQEVSPEAAKQFLDYLGQLEPYVQRQIDAFCPKS
ncbi:MAG TPA: tetratricopeptide repeat protein, partial [Gemmatimonadaceae bacterium]|nr:tetratricopeptide repeat protein [Gemmatimonadaceae bacterium]